MIISRVGKSLLRSAGRAPSFLRNTPMAMFTRGYAAEDLEKEARDKIDGMISSSDVVVFMKGTPGEPRCGFSGNVMKIFKLAGIKKFNSYNVLEDPELRENIKVYSDWPTIPQIYLNKEFVGGFDLLLGMYQDDDEFKSTFGSVMEELSDEEMKKVHLEVYGVPYEQKGDEQK